MSIPAVVGSPVDPSSPVVDPEPSPEVESSPVLEASPVVAVIPMVSVPDSEVSKTGLKSPRQAPMVRIAPKTPMSSFGLSFTVVFLSKGYFKHDRKSRKYLKPGLHLKRRPQ